MKLIDPIYRLLFAEEKTWREMYMEIKGNIEKLGIEVPKTLYDKNQENS